MFRRGLDWGNALDDLKDLTFLTVDQSASVLNCPKKTVYFWIEQGKIPIYQFGGRKGIRIKHDDLQNFIDSKRETAPGVPNARF
jgi:excisionase family DNA binding protein